MIHKLDGQGRLDFEVYNEANAFVLCSKNLSGRDPEDLDSYEQGAKWRKAIHEGIFVPISLYSDDSFNTRLVMGDLNEAEKANWIGRLSWPLQIPDGSLVFSAGTEYVEGDLLEVFTHFIQVPPGNYKVTVYTYPTGPNAQGWSHEGNRKEPLIVYFKRTCPNDPIPAWIERACLDNPDEDPDGTIQDDRYNEITRALEKKAYIDFLIHLEPLPEGRDVKNAKEEGILREKEWRTPEKCPFGLESQTLSEKKGKEGKAEKPIRAVKTKDIFSLVEGSPLSSI